MSASLMLGTYVLGTLMADLVGHDRRPSAYLVYLAIWAAGEGARTTLSYGELSARTGLSKRAVQMAVAHLRRRGLIEINRPRATETPRYRPLTPWRRFQRNG